MGIAADGEEESKLRRSFPERAEVVQSLLNMGAKWRGLLFNRRPIHTLF